MHGRWRSHLIHRHALYGAFTCVVLTLFTYSPAIFLMPGGLLICRHCSLFSSPHEHDHLSLIFLRSHWPFCLQALRCPTVTNLVQWAHSHPRCEHSATHRDHLALSVPSFTAFYPFAFTSSTCWPYFHVSFHFHLQHFHARTALTPPNAR